VATLCKTDKHTVTCPVLSLNNNDFYSYVKIRHRQTGYTHAVAWD